MRTAFALFRLAVLFVVALDSQALGQTRPVTTSVQIVNATSVPAIALKINDKIAYENFPQGLKTADLLRACSKQSTRRKTGKPDLARRPPK